MLTVAATLSQRPAVGAHRRAPAAEGRSSLFISTVSTVYVRRVAIAAAELFLLANGYRLTADDRALEELTLAAAASHIDVEEIRIWFEQRIRRE